MEKYRNKKASDFTHIGCVSWYNNNYYVGLDKELLFAESNDDNLTEWYIKTGLEFIHFADSYTSENDVLHLLK